MPRTAPSTPTSELVHDTEKGGVQHLESHDDPMVVGVSDNAVSREINPTERRLVRKLDWTILPILWINYWLNYLDRNAITVARLDKMEKELGLTSVQYQTCVSILFVGYILGQVPAS
jgi:hypothetical protein